MTKQEEEIIIKNWRKGMDKYQLAKAFQKIKNREYSLDRHKMSEKEALNEVENVLIKEWRRWNR